MEGMSLIVVIMAGSVVVYFLLGLAIGLALKERQGGRVQSGKGGIYLEPVGGYDTDPFAAQDLPFKEASNV